jgi:hypothetical protein
VFAVIPEFGLRLHQSPTGHDVRYLAEHLAAPAVQGVRMADAASGHPERS